MRAIVAFALLGLIAGIVLIALIEASLPPLDTLGNYEPALITRVYDRNGVLITEFAEERRRIVPLEAMPRHLLEAFLAAEDDNFYDHFGVEPLAILRAALANFLAGRTVQGASTITQQVARSFFLTQKRTITRKLREILLALKLERNLSKDEILFLYLNQIYLGRGAYGVAAAAEMYFGKELAQLTLAESAVLAGLPPAPSTYAPHVAPEKARARQMYVLGRLRRLGWIDAEAYAAAVSEPVAIYRWEAPFWRAPYVSEAVRTWLLERFDATTVMRGGLQVYTSIDLERTQAAAAAVRNGLIAHDRRQGYRGPVTHLATEAARAAWRTQAAAKLLDRLNTELRGGVIAYVGPATADARIPDAYGKPATALIGMDMVFPGLVTGFHDARRVAWVDFGLGTAQLPEIGMVWARQPDPDVDTNTEIVRHPRERLRVGDVIELRRLRLNDDAPEWMREREQALRRDLGQDGAPLLAELWQEPEAQAALVSVLPQSGEIVAMVGGYDYASSQFNRALMAARQPGSAFKPIVYSLALDRGFTPASILIDTPLVYQDVEREYRWKPKNYEGKFYGPMTLTDALTHSRNVVTIQLARELGITAIQERARALGIASELPNDLSLALGSGVVTPVELVRPYATFANAGYRPEIVLVREVWDATGKPVYQYFPPVTREPALRFSPFVAAPPPAVGDVPFKLRAVEPVSAPELVAFPQVLSPETAYQMTYLLRNVVERGTGWRARVLGRPTAGKTGTTDDNIDSWFAGFTADLATVVWVGYDQLRSLGKYETGSRAAAPIWTEYMLAAQRGLPVRDFEVPPGIVMRRIDAEKGTLATPLSKKVLLMPFREGTEPGASGAQEPSLLDTSDWLHSPDDW